MSHGAVSADGSDLRVLPSFSELELSLSLMTPSNLSVALRPQNSDHHLDKRAKLASSLVGTPGGGEHGKKGRNFHPILSPIVILTDPSFLSYEPIFR
jgi:hypothetical protein